MKAIQFDLNLPKYGISKVLGKLNPSLYVESPFSCLSLEEIEKPSLPNEEWVEIDIKYGGICGSDLNLINLNDSPAASPFVSFPLTLGHEIVGKISTVGEKVKDFSVGERVVVDPILSCEVRGISPRCEECQKGNYHLCHHMTKGDISAGLLTGMNKDTGGSWGNYVVAHQSQVIRLPDKVNDLNGVLIEPFACGLHAVLRNKPKQTDTVFVIGAGVIGLCVIAAIRALDIPCKIVTSAKYPFQADLAKHYGADEVINLSSTKESIKETAAVFDAEVLNPILGEAVVNGGADIVYDCVGSKRSTDDSIRFTRKGGQIVVIGLTSIIDKLDMTMVWMNELEIKGNFTYGLEDYKGKQKRTMQIAVDLMEEEKVDLSRLVSHIFPLDRYKQAISTVSSKKTDQAMKVLFEP